MVMIGHALGDVAAGDGGGEARVAAIRDRRRAHLSYKVRVWHHGKRRLTPGMAGGHPARPAPQSGGLHHAQGARRGGAEWLRPTLRLFPLAVAAAGQPLVHRRRFDDGSEPQKRPAQPDLHRNHAAAAGRHPAGRSAGAACPIRSDSSSAAARSRPHPPP